MRILTSEISKIIISVRKSRLRAGKKLGVEPGSTDELYEIGYHHAIGDIRDKLELRRRGRKNRKKSKKG